MRRRLSVPTGGGLTLVAAVLALMLAGCGSGGAAAQQHKAVTATVQAYLHGILTGDGAEVCSHLTPQLRSEQTAALNKELGHTTAATTLSCAAAFEKVSAAIPQKDRSRPVDVTSVTVTGDAATARVKGGSGTAHLVKQNGQWLLGASPSSTSTSGS